MISIPQMVKNQTDCLEIPTILGSGTPLELWEKNSVLRLPIFPKLPKRHDIHILRTHRVAPTTRIKLNSIEKAIRMKYSDTNLRKLS